MKRFILIIPLFCLLFSSSASAQVKVGIKAGINAATVRFTDLPTHYSYLSLLADTEHKVGCLAGIWTTLPINKYFFVQPEVQFSVKGWRHSEPDLELGDDLFYLNLPLLLGYKPIPKLSLAAGIEFGFLVDHNNEIPGLDNYNRFERGFAAGVSYEIIEDVKVEFRFSHGLSKISTWQVWEDTYHTGNYTGGKNQALQLSLAYAFKKNSYL